MRRICVFSIHQLSFINLGIFGNRDGYMEGRGFSRFLKQVDSHMRALGYQDILDDDDDDDEEDDDDDDIL